MRALVEFQWRIHIIKAWQSPADAVRVEEQSLGDRVEVEYFRS
jgi:hypothetical protein